jgi:hypothetical protein
MEGYLVKAVVIAIAGKPCFHDGIEYNRLKKQRTQLKGANRPQYLSKVALKVVERDLGLRPKVEV